MAEKPECVVLTGEWGKKVYENIMNAKPLSKPQYTKKERDAFNRDFLRYLPDIINNWNKSVQK